MQILRKSCNTVVFSFADCSELKGDSAYTMPGIAKKVKISSNYWRSVTFMPTIDFTGIIMPQFFQGFAVACFFLPLTTISFSGLPDNKFANASSMSNFFRTLSGSVGTSLTMTLWGRRESLHHSQLTATIDQFNPVFNSSSQIMDKYYGSLSGVLNEINNEITQQSLSISANEIFRMAAIAFILLTVLVWFAKPPFTAKGVG